MAEVVVSSRKKPSKMLQLYHACLTSLEVEQFYTSLYQLPSEMFNILCIVLFFFTIRVMYLIFSFLIL